MAVERSVVESYYDEHVIAKLTGYVNGNARVEAAWRTLVRWSPRNPRRILEIGCGIGDITHRLSLTFTSAEVVGLDISPRSIEIAGQLFGSNHVSFVAGYLTSETFSDRSEPFNLVVMMDMYEHLGVVHRPEFHAVIRSLLAETGRVFLSCPTPHHQAFLRQYTPEELQPVDEDITVNVFQELSADLGTNLLYYSEVDVWNEADYCHAVLGSRLPRTPSVTQVSNSKLREIARKLRLRQRLSDMKEILRRDASPWHSTRRERLSRLRQRLGRTLDLD